MAVTAATRVVTFCGFMLAFTWTLGAFIWTSGRKESNSAWYAFHTGHVL